MIGFGSIEESLVAGIVFRNNENESVPHYHCPPAKPPDTDMFV